MQINADVTQARETHVTGYAEHRGSLNDKKKYRRAINIDLKLPEASTALAGVPRRKDFPAGEEGRQAWKAQFNAFSGDFAYSHVGAETVKRRMGSVGMWGDYTTRPPGLGPKASSCHTVSTISEGGSLSAVLLTTTQWPARMLFECNLPVLLGRADHGGAAADAAPVPHLRRFRAAGLTTGTRRAYQMVRPLVVRQSSRAFKQGIQAGYSYSQKRVGPL